jgi:hypothetical protein
LSLARSDLQQSHALQAPGKLWARLAKEARFGDFTSKHACSSGICLHAIIGDDYLKIARNMVRLSFADTDVVSMFT